MTFEIIAAAVTAFNDGMEGLVTNAMLLDKRIDAVDGDNHDDGPS